MYKENVLLSVIVPAYNVDGYIEKCIKSIINQTYENIEIIIIDDGSTDATGNICDKLAESDERIKIIHKKNEGLVSARKLGAKHANGEIVTFVDGDDWIENEMYSSMIQKYKKEKNTDMVSSGIVYEFPDRLDMIFDDLKEGTYNRKDILKFILPLLVNNGERCRNQILTSVWNKIFKIELLNKIINKVDSDLTLGEDGATIFFYLAEAKKVSVMHQAWYHYVQHDGSMIRSYDFDSFKQIDKLKKCIEEGMNQCGMLNVVELQINYYVKAFLGNAVRDIYGNNIWEPEFFFPYYGLPNDSKVILYGAGRVGYSYWKYIQYSKCIHLIAWVDKNYKEKQHQNPFIEPVSVITKKDYDYIIVAVENRKVVQEIEKEILEYGIEEYKLIWRPTQKLI